MRKTWSADLSDVSRSSSDLGPPSTSSRWCGRDQLPLVTMSVSHASLHTGRFGPAVAMAVVVAVRSLRWCGLWPFVAMAMVAAVRSFYRCGL